jgi:hypothetical protein
LGKTLGVPLFQEQAMRHKPATLPAIARRIERQSVENGLNPRKSRLVHGQPQKRCVTGRVRSGLVAD